MTSDRYRGSITLPVIFLFRMEEILPLRFWINSTWLSRRVLRWHCFTQSVKFASIIAHNVTSQPSRFNWNPGVAVCTNSVFYRVNQCWSMSLTLFLACQSRDFASILAGDWRDFVASGFSEVSNFVRPTSLRFEAEELCLLCCSATPHLVLPCGHVAMCTECLDKYLRTPKGRECLLCRQSLFAQLSLSRLSAFFWLFTVVFPPAPDDPLIRNTKRPSDQSTGAQKCPRYWSWVLFVWVWGGLDGRSVRFWCEHWCTVMHSVIILRSKKLSLFHCASR